VRSSPAGKNRNVARSCRVSESQRPLPAYRAFLANEDYRSNGAWKLSELPITTKENYVKKYSIVERCYYGRLPGAA